MSRNRPRDVKRSRDVIELQSAVKRTLLEASKNFPEGKSNPLKREWCRVTTIMVMELLKRKSVPRKTMVKNARKQVKRKLETEHTERILRTDFPPLAPPEAPPADQESEHDPDDDLDRV